MNKREKEAREKLRERDIHVTRKGGAHIEEHAMVHKDRNVIQNIKDSIRILKGK